MRSAEKSLAVNFDASTLVGRTLTIYSDQFPAKPLICRVLSTKSREIEIDGSSSDGLITNLVNHQELITQFSYGGQDISVKAMFRKTSGGRCLLSLDKRIVPLSQRRFERVDLQCSVSLATYPLVGSQVKQLVELRWIETKSVNLSSGGLLVRIPSYLHVGVMVVLHLQVPGLSFPQLILGQVKHCYQFDATSYQAGIEFVVKEIGVKVVPPARRVALPASAFEYSARSREQMNRDLRQIGRRIAGKENRRTT